jgi:hypothetical protein
MRGTNTARREHRRNLARALFVLVLLPMLLLGPALGGVAASLHAHGDAGAHVHVLALGSAAECGSSALQDWHATQHQHSDGAPTTGADDRAPEGLTVEFPAALAQSAAAPRPRVVGDAAFAALLPIPLAVPCLASGHRAPLARTESPPPRAARTGVAALLRSSHAILI